MIKFKTIFKCLAISLCIGLTGCSKNITPGDYDSAEVGKIKKVVPGVIISKRPVRIHNPTAESTSSTIDNSNPAAANAASGDAGMNRTHGYEYVIRLNSGAIISLVQTEDLNLKTKQHILVIYGNNTRVVADDGSDDY